MTKKNNGFRKKSCFIEAFPKFKVYIIYKKLIGTISMIFKKYIQNKIFIILVQ